MIRLVACSLVALSAFSFVGCASSQQEGVKTSYHAQWTNVNADTMTTTEAAKAVLADRELKSVEGKSTKVDGKAMAKMADGTEVKVTITKETPTSSEVSVTVGTLGDPKLGAEIAKAIKMKAEEMPKMNPSTMKSM